MGLGLAWEASASACSLVAAAVSCGAGGGGPWSRDRGVSEPGWAIPLGGKPRSRSSPDSLTAALGTSLCDGPVALVCHRVFGARPHAHALAYGHALTPRCAAMIEAAEDEDLIEEVVGPRRQCSLICLFRPCTDLL